jgi:1-phosphofructokinase family hexose kinase
MGRDTKAYGFMAGPSGHVMCTLLDRVGVPYEFVEAEGDTRINTVLVDLELEDQTTVIVESLRVREAHVEKIEALVRDRAAEATAWVFSGSLPPGAPPDLWARLISIVKEAGAVTVLDSSGEGLRQGLAARPHVIKPNLPELEEACGRSLPSLEHMRDAAESLMEEGPEWVVASLGEMGLLAVSRAESYAIPAMEVPVTSTSGAGDGVVSGLAIGLEQGADLATAARLGAAVATSVVTQPGTAQCDPADVERFFREIKAERLE